jgi:hypothetical protein
MWFCECFTCIELWPISSYDTCTARLVIWFCCPSLYNRGVLVGYDEQGLKRAIMQRTARAGAGLTQFRRQDGSAACPLGFPWLPFGGKSKQIKSFESLAFPFERLQWGCCKGKGQRKFSTVDPARP